MGPHWVAGAAGTATTTTEPAAGAAGTAPEPAAPARPPGVCECGKRKQYCVWHGGSAMCACGKRRDKCRLHGGAAFCACGRRRELCAQHGGSALCACGKRKEFCREHGGSALCLCGKRRNVCRLHGGSSLCPCGRRRELCREHGGSMLCPCGRRKDYCSVHGGSQICQHKVRRESCAHCHPAGHLMRLARNATRRAFRRVGERKTATTRAWLGCSDTHLQGFIQRKMQHWNEHNAEEMTMDNIDIDHIKPISTARTVTDITVLTHFSNLQPLLKRHNLTKSARWAADDEAPWARHVSRHDECCDIYWPRACPPLRTLDVQWRSLYVLAQTAAGLGSG